MTLQFIFGILILRWSFGKDVFQCIGDKVSVFLEFSDEGSAFVFDYLVTGVLQGNITVGANNNVTLPMPIQTAIFAFQV